MRKLGLTVLIVCFAAASSFGFNYHFDAFTDGETPFDHNNNWAPYDYPNGVGELPSPGTQGEGGEKFDLEGLQVTQDQDFVYVAIANSFGYSAYSSAWNQSYDMGDLFIGVNGEANKYAIDLYDVVGTGSADFYQTNGSYTGIPDIDGSYYDYSAIRTAAGAHQIGGGANMLGSIDLAQSFAAGYETNYMTPGNGDTYVWEFRIDRDLLGDFNTLDFHINLACGNDWMNSSYTPVPEPTTLLLFSLGLAGAGIVRRKVRS